MKNIKIIRAIGCIDDELVERAALKKKEKHNKFAPWAKWALPVAACLVIMVAALPFMLRNPAPNIDNDSLADNNAAGDNAAGIDDAANNNATFDESLVAAALDAIFGLPTSNFTWDEGDGIAADRMIANELRYLMRAFDSREPDVKTAFAIVGVASVEPFADTNEWRRSKGQIANCGVLYNVLGDGIVEPLAIKQYLYGGCTNDEETNLLRVGGVYVLPLINWQDEGFWTICDDLDSLFEVDEKGLIQSHSRHEQLNKYDSQELSVLWNDIEYLYVNPILHSQFAENITLHGYEIAVDNNRIALHSIASGWYGWDGADKEGFSAEIGAGGRIEIATNGFNVFRPVEGMTVDEVHAEVLKIKQFTGLLEHSPAVDPQANSPSADIPDERLQGEIDSGITMSIRSATPSGLSFILGNSTYKEYTFGADYVLYRQNNDSWEVVEPIIENWGIDSIGYLLMPQSETDIISVDWVWLYGKLLSGSYKFQKEILFVRQPGDLEKYIIEQEFTLPPIT